MRKLKVLSILLVLMFIGCSVPTEEPQPSPMVKRAIAVVNTDDRGRTVEQNNIIERYKLDNEIGSIKHLYIISAYSGQVLIYSTVKGKVTSSGKRLSPGTISTNGYPGMPITVGQDRYMTGEVIQDDGTYGDSIEYLYWFDSKGIYHQQYITGGMILHISNQPMPIKSVILNLELTD